MMIVQILKMEEDVLHIIMNVPNALILKINKVVQQQENVLGIIILVEILCKF